MSLLLDDNERLRFMAWCRQFSESNKLLVKASDGTPYAAALTKKLNVEAMACEVVARILEQTECQTVEAR